MFNRRRNKFGNIWTVVDGIKFQSKGEARYYRALRLLEKAGQIRELRLQVPFPLLVNGIKIGVYKADFCYFNVDYHQEIVDDFKGQETDIFKWKWKHLQAQEGKKYIYRITKSKAVTEILKRLGG